MPSVVPPRDGIDARLVHAVLGRRKRAAILAVPLPGPLQRHVDDRPFRPGDVRADAGVVDLQEARVGDLGDERDLFAGST